MFLLNSCFLTQNHITHNLLFEPIVLTDKSWIEDNVSLVGRTSLKIVGDCDFSCCVRLRFTKYVRSPLKSSLAPRASAGLKVFTFYQFLMEMHFYVSSIAQNIFIKQMFGLRPVFVNMFCYLSKEKGKKCFFDTSSFFVKVNLPEFSKVFETTKEWTCVRYWCHFLKWPFLAIKKHIEIISWKFCILVLQL